MCQAACSACHDMTAALTHSFFDQTWQALGGSADHARHVTFTGDRAFAGCFGYTDLCAATLGAASAAIAELLAVAGHAPPAVTVNREVASGWVVNLTRPLAPRVPLKWPWTVNGEYRTADDRYLRLTAVYQHQNARTLAALGNPRNADELREEIRSRRADEAEQAVVDGGSVAAASRSIDE